MSGFEDSGIGLHAPQDVASACQGAPVSAGNEWLPLKSSHADGVAPDKDVVDDDWLALGLTLRLLTTEEGGRTKPLGPSDGEYVKFQYRPNWGLPGMVGIDQVGAFVLWFGGFPVALGNTTRAVIVPFAPGSLPLWREVRPGDELRMFEGARVCGRAVVEWARRTQRPVPVDDQGQYIAWAEGGEISA